MLQQPRVLNATVKRALTVGQRIPSVPLIRRQKKENFVDYFWNNSGAASNTLQLLMLLCCFSDMRRTPVRGYCPMEDLKKITTSNAFHN